MNIEGTKVATKSNDNNRLSCKLLYKMKRYVNNERTVLTLQSHFENIGIILCNAPIIYAIKVIVFRGGMGVSNKLALFHLFLLHLYVV